MARKNRGVNDTKAPGALDPQLVVDDFAQRARPDEVVLRADMVLDVLDPFLLGVQADVGGRQFSLVQRLGEDGVVGDAVHPAHPRREDFGVDLVAEVAWVDLGGGQRVGGLDVYGASGQRVLQAHEQRDLLASRRRRGEELGLVGPLGHVEAGAYAECLEVGKGRVAELVDDDLWGYSQLVFVLLSLSKWRENTLALMVVGR